MFLCLAIVLLTILPRHYLAIHLTDGTTVRAEGKRSEETDYPLVVLVNIGNKSCSGTVLDDSWVLTLSDCAKGTSEEPVWVSSRASSYKNNTEPSKEGERHAAKLHWGPTESRLLLLELDKPVQRGSTTDSLIFSKSDKVGDLIEPCKVAGFDISSNQIRTIEAQLLHGNECVIPVVTSTPTDKTEGLVGFNANAQISRNSTGDPVDGSVVKKSTDGNESKQAPLCNTVLCSTGLRDGDLLVGSPVVCHGIVVALATGKSEVESSHRESEKLQSYYALIQPQDKWIQKALPWIHVSNEDGRNGDDLLTEEECKLKSLLRLRRMSQIIFPWWTRLLMPSSYEDKISKRAKLNRAESPDTANALYQSISWWLPLERTVRANLWRYDFDDQPNFELKKDPLEAQESLRISNYVKKSATRQNLANRTTLAPAREKIATPTTTLRPLKRVKRKTFKPEISNSNKKTAVLPITLLRRLRSAGQRDTRSILSLRKSAGLPSWRRVRYSPEFKK